MADQTAATERATQAALVCRLRPKQLARGGSVLAGEVELENLSSQVLQIEIDMHPLQHLNLLVRDADGALISGGHYGDIFSPLGETRTFQLTPGATYTHNVFLLGTVPEERRKPGRYRVQAIYVSGNVTAISAPLEIELR
jgi:hypothetical protein